MAKLIFIQFMPMFVMRTNFKYNDAKIITNKAKTKIQGRHIGESPTAFFRHRLEFVRSDRPTLLFNKSTFIMRTKESEKRTGNTIVLTPAVQELLEFLSPIEIPDLLKYFTRVFEKANFHSTIEHSDSDITALFMQYEFIKLLKQIENETRSLAPNTTV